MRRGERFHSKRLPENSWVVVRVDGHSFSRLTSTHFQKPFDEAFHHSMVQAAQALIEEFNGVYAYTESDEISLLLPLDWSTFDRSHEKTISLSAGLASSVFTQASGHLAHFDSRVWIGQSENAVLDYFRWRQSDAARCALNGWCYWMLRQQGQSSAEATKSLEGQSTEFKRELLLQNNIDFNEVPLWQQRGMGLYWDSYSKPGYNPITQQTVTAKRRRVTVENDLPTGGTYAAFVYLHMQLSTAKA